MSKHFQGIFIESLDLVLYYLEEKEKNYAIINTYVKNTRIRRNSKRG